MSASLHRERLLFSPRQPALLAGLGSFEPAPTSFTASEELQREFPHTYRQPLLRWVSGEIASSSMLRVGAVFSGGQAAGGHNVIAGLHDALKRIHPDSVLYGFLDGPSGIISGSHIPITEELLANYRNQGGFDLLGSGRTKIETDQQLAAAAKIATELQLDGLVIIGGDDSNTNAAILAEHYLANGIPTRVIGVPKTIDGDLKNEQIEVSFGFDSATKVYSEVIGNVLRDSLSAKKYYFFIKLMGRSASHVTLECALQTHPNLALIGEEVAEKQYIFRDLVTMICDLICRRAEQGKDYGVILIPEGLIEFIPDFQASLPADIAKQLLLDKDPHGNIQVSKIETERLLIQAVTAELELRRSQGMFKGSFSPQPLFCGYEGRCGYPSNFDANYCYALGSVAALLIHSGATGYISCVQRLSEPVERWVPLGLPLTHLMHFELRKGKRKPVIRKALVDLEGPVFQEFAKRREGWMMEDDYRYPGPMQFFGPEELTDSITMTLRLESKKRR